MRRQKGYALAPGRRAGILPLLRSAGTIRTLAETPTSRSMRRRSLTDRCSVVSCGAPARERGLIGICRPLTRKTHTAARRAIRSSEGEAFGIWGIWTGSRSSIAARRRGGPSVPSEPCGPRPRPTHRKIAPYNANIGRRRASATSLAGLDFSAPLQQFSHAVCAGPSDRSGSHSSVHSVYWSRTRPGARGVRVPGKECGNRSGRGVESRVGRGDLVPCVGRCSRTTFSREETEKWETMRTSGGRAIADGRM